MKGEDLQKNQIIQKDKAVNASDLTERTPRNLFWPFQSLSTFSDSGQVILR